MTLLGSAFDKYATADQVADGVDMTGRRVVVTGAASGIGVETARTLARHGAEVTMAVRDVAAGAHVADDIRTTTGSELVHVELLDLVDGESIDAFVERWEGPLDVLVNNAGIMACPEAHTREGWELQFATNHLGHFQLALGLHDALATAGMARIVSVSSSGHRISPVHLDDLDFTDRAYEPWQAYGQSKTANVLFAVEATRRWAHDGITANALMPGGIMTKLQQHVDDTTKARWAAGVADGTVFMKSPEQGAATSVLLATWPLLDGVGGRYFEDNVEQPVVDDDSADPGVRAWAVDPETARTLWDRSLELLTAR